LPLKLEWLESRLAPANVSVTSFHYDPSLTGENLQETALTPTNVNATNFGKLANVAVDGYVYAQPLYMANLMIGGQPHNVVFVATEHDSLYAFDVINDPSATTGVRLNQLWQRSFINPASGINTVPSGDVGSTDIVPEIGITGGGVIDPATNTLYVVAKTKEVRADGNHYVQTLYAIDITSPTGANKTAPYVIGDSHGGDGYNNQNTVIQVAGAGADTSGGANPMVRFSAFRNDQRPSLQLLGGRVYVAWSSHGDQGPYHGWVVGFNEATLQPEKWFNITPNAHGGGIWQSEGAVSTDGTYLYFAEGNGFNGPNLAFDAAHGNYSEAVMKLDPRPAGTLLTVADYFVPNDWQSLDNSDADLGSGGVMLLPDSVGSTAHPHLMVETGKSGKIYLIDRDNLGQNVPAGQPDRVVQIVTAGPGGVWGNPSFYQESANSGLIYYHGSGTNTRVFRVSNGMITPANSVYTSNQSFGFPGAQPILTDSGANNPSGLIDWELQVDNYGTQGPAQLHAYSLPTGSTGTLNEIYNSNQTGLRDKLAGSVKFISAIVTNGWVFVGQEYNFSVFGLFPTHTAVPGAPTTLHGMGVSPTSIEIDWTNPSPNTATGIKIFRSTDGTNFSLFSTVAAGVTTFTDTGLNQSGTYYYKVAATNQVGDSGFSNTVQLNPLIAAPVLSIDNISSVKVSLMWTIPSVANDHYSVERSTDPSFGTFTTVAMNLPGNMSSYVDNNSTAGQYYYRIRAFTSSNQPALSNVVAVKIGAGSQTIDYFQSGSFPPSPPDLQANGDAQFAEGTARLVHQNQVAGSAFSVNEKNVLSFDDDFSIRLHEGTQPNYANGLAFVIQAVSAGALGQGGQGLGYQGIPESICIKFDTFTGGSENGTGGSTGLFFGGDRPDVPHQPGEVNIPLDATMGVNLESQSVKQIEISYDYNPSNPGASILHEEIVDSDHPTMPFEQDYMIDIPSKLGLATSGNTIGYVGFTASTGSGATPGFWELEDVTSWRYLPTGPAAPHNLSVTSTANANNLSWKTTSADEDGYYIERSESPTTGFTRIATITAANNTWTYNDPNLTNPQSYFYRVQTFNHDTTGQEQDSGYSNIASGAVVSVAFPSFPANHPGLSANTGTAPPVNVFPGSPPVMRLTDGNNNEVSSSFFTTPIGVGPFSTTFTLHDVPNGGAADSASFVIQNDPRGVTALGGGGGSGGYSGITHSIAVKFDLYTQGSHNSSTGLYLNGEAPSDSGPQVIMGPTPIDLRTGHPMQVTLIYDGTTLNEMIRDTVTNGMFQHSYPLNLQQVIGGPTAYVGFTGATGGENATQDILTWTGQFSIVAGAASLSVTGFPSPTTAGTSGNFTVTARDPNGFVVPGYRGVVHFSSSDTLAVLPANYTFTASDNGVHTFSAILNSLGTQSITATDTVTSSITGTQDGIVVNAGAATHLSVTGYPSPATAGTFAAEIVTALDAYGNTATGYTGTVHMTSSDAQAYLDPDHTFTAADGGVYEFGVVLGTAGPQSITATDSVNSNITGAQTGIAITPGATSIFAVSGFPSPVTAGTAGMVTVTAQDAYGNATPAYRGTVHLSSSDPQAMLDSDYTFMAGDNGVHIFMATLKTAGTQSITATDTAMSSITGTQDGIVVNPDVAVRLVVADYPSPVLAGTDNAFDVTAVDAYGNTATGYRGTIHFTSSDPGAGFDPDYTFQASDGGMAFFDAVLFTAGTQSITATDTVTSNISGTQMGIMVVPAAASTFIVSGFPSPVNAGDQGMVTVAAQDPYGNTATGYRGIVHFTSSDGQAMLPMDYTFVAGDNGVHMFPVTLRTAGTQSITATDTADATITGTQAGIVVNPGPLNGFAVTGYPSPVVAGTPNLFRVRAIDAYNNTISGYLGTVHFTGSDPIAQLPVDYSFTADDNGMHEFGAILKTVGIQSITATNTTDNTITGMQAGITVIAGPASSFVVNSFPSPITAGDVGIFTVTAYDQYGNVATGYTGVVHFTSSDPAAELPDNYTFTASDQGSQMFAAALHTTGTQSITATDTVDGSITGTQDGIVVNPHAATGSGGSPASLAVGSAPVAAAAVVPTVNTSTAAVTATGARPENLDQFFTAFPVPSSVTGASDLGALTDSALLDRPDPVIDDPVFAGIV
jgi:hypothetical protein